MTTNQGEVTTNQGEVTTNKGEVTTNEGKVGTNAAGATVGTNAKGAVINWNNGKLTNAIEGKIDTNNADVAENAATGVIGENYATVTTNKGEVNTNIKTISTNEGTVGINNASVEKNNKRVETNYGYVYENNGTVETNNGGVETNSGTVQVNAGTVTDNTGTVEDNSGGTVTNNYEGTVNGGTVTNNYFGVEISTENAEASGKDGFTIYNEKEYLKDGASITVTPEEGYTLSKPELDEESGELSAEGDENTGWKLSFSNLLKSIRLSIVGILKPAPEPEPEPAPALAPAPAPEPEPEEPKQESISVPSQDYVDYFYLFNKAVVEMIMIAPENGTVEVDAGNYTGFLGMVFDALLARPDVSLEVQTRSGSLTIPAGGGVSQEFIHRIGNAEKASRSYISFDEVLSILSEL